MRITANQIIAGYPAQEVRNFVREHRLSLMSKDAAEIAFKLNHSAASDFLHKLAAEGIIEKYTERQGTTFYALTQFGQALAGASAAKPIHRKTAERVLQQFLERVHQVNATPDYLYRVEDVVLFGSMLSNAQRLGDVDVAVNLEPKVSDRDTYREWSWRRQCVAIEGGKLLGMITEQAYWPMYEVLRQLKAGSHSLSLLEIASLQQLSGLPYRVLIGDPKRIAKYLPNGHIV